MNTEVKRILGEVGEGRRLLERAQAHIQEGMESEGIADLETAFRRLAPIPPRVYRLVERQSQLAFMHHEDCQNQDTLRLSQPECSYTTPYIFRCYLHTPPFLRSQRNGREYAQILGLEISQAVAATLPKRHHRFREIDVIFVNHLLDTSSEKQPYYDNDNLLIKRMLDSIISFVAFDDAAQYCTNLYTYERGEKEGFSIFVVEQGHLLEWAGMCPNSVLSKEICMNSGQMSG